MSRVMEKTPFPVPKSSAAAFECGQPPPLPRSNQNLAGGSSSPPFPQLSLSFSPSLPPLPNCKCSARSDLPKIPPTTFAFNVTSHSMPFSMQKRCKKGSPPVCPGETEGSVFTCHSDQSISRRVFKYLNIIYYICHCTLGAFKRRDSTMCSVFPRNLGSKRDTTFAADDPPAPYSLPRSAVETHATSQMPLSPPPPPA